MKKRFNKRVKKKHLNYLRYTFFVIYSSVVPYVSNQAGFLDITTFNFKLLALVTWLDFFGTPVRRNVLGYLGG